MKITLQKSNKEKHTIDICGTKKVLDLKKELESIMEEGTKILAADQVYIFGGKILKDEESLKDIENLKDDSLIYIIGKSKAKKDAQPTITAPTAPIHQAQNVMPNFNMQQNFTPSQSYPQSHAMPQQNNDMMGFNFQQGVEQLKTNPFLIDSLYGSMMQNMSEPEKESFRNVLINQITELQKNPQMMNHVMTQARNVNPGMYGYGNQGEMGHQYPQPPYQQPIPCSHGFFPYQGPHHNQDSSPYVGGYGNNNVAQQRNLSPNLEEIYSTELSTLAEMGYSNKKLNLEALKKSNGDINLAIHLLIDWAN